MPVAQNVRQKLTFEQLVRRYWKNIRGSQQEALGLLHASLRVEDASESEKEEVVSFLMEVANEISQREPDSELREDARRLLARKVGEESFRLGAGAAIADKLYDFYLVSPKHMPSPTRDRKLVHSFLQATIKDPPRQSLVRLLVTVGDYVWLRDDVLYDAIPLLYRRLLDMLREKGMDGFEHLAETHGVSASDAAMKAFPLEVQSKTKTDFLLKLVQLHTVCGIVFLYYHDEQLHECARTLLYLVSCSATVAGDPLGAEHH